MASSTCLRPRRNSRDYRRPVADIWARRERRYAFRRKLYDDGVNQLRAAGVPDHCDPPRPGCREGRLDVMVSRVLEQRNQARAEVERFKAAIVDMCSVSPRTGLLIEVYEQLSDETIATLQAVKDTLTAKERGR